MKKPNLLILTPGFPTDESDSITVPYIQDWLREAIKTFEIKVISFQYPFEKKTYQWQNIEIFAAGGKNKGFPFRLFTWLKIWQKMNKWHKKEPFQVILCFWLTETSLIGEFFVKKNPKIKLFRWALGQDVKKENQYLKYLNLNIGTLFSLSEYSANYLKQKSHILQFGFPKVDFNPSQTRKIDIIGIGSHIPLKRYDFFISLIAKLKPEFLDIQCLLIGEGQDSFSLKRQVQDLGIENNIIFLSKVSRQAIFDYLAQSKILLHTSSHEGQCMVLGEALQMGCYVICSNVGHLVKHHKMNICLKDEDFLPALKKVLSQQSFDFEGVEIVKMEESIRKLYEIFNENVLERK